jgi:hypothetical protein
MSALVHKSNHTCYKFSGLRQSFSPSMHVEQLTLPVSFAIHVWSEIFDVSNVCMLRRIGCTILHKKAHMSTCVHVDAHILFYMKNNWNFTSKEPNIKISLGTWFVT